MKRTLNWTGRKTIPLEKVLVRVIEASNGSPSSFSAELTDLQGLGLPPDARVYVEPYVGTSSMRFDFGTVSAPTIPTDTSMTEIDAGSLPLFRVRVVDETADVGKILAAADGIRPSNEVEDDDRKSLLPVAYRDLGEGIWDLDLEPGARPLLVLNNRIPELADRIRTDHPFQGAVVAHAVRRILEKLFLDDEHRDGDWVKDWHEFAADLREGVPLDDDGEESEKQAAINDVVQRFIVRTKWVSQHRRGIELKAEKNLHE